MRFVSIKIQAPLLIIILALVALGLSVWLMTEQLASYREDYTAKRQQEIANDFNLQVRNLRRQLTVQTEQILLLNQTDFFADIATLFDNVESIWPEFSLISDLESLSFHRGNNGELYRAIGNLNIDNSQQLAAITLRQAEPVSTILCEQVCYFYLSVPAVVGDEFFAAVIKTELTGLILQLAETSNVQIGLMTQQADLIPQLRYQTRDQLFAFSLLSNPQFTWALVKRANDTSLLNELSDRKVNLEFQSGNYALWVTPIDDQPEQTYQLLVIDETTSLFNEQQKQIQKTLLILSAVVVVITLLAALFTSSHIKRVTQLSKLLPLLPDKKYRPIRQSLEGKSTWVSNEIDQLEQTTLKLADSLEHLDLLVEEKADELENMAMYDHLTGLANRNLFIFEANQFLRSRQPSEQDLAILFFDLDGFKAVNDNLGHDIGDRLLIEVGQRTQAALRAGDLVCRFGGDEFAVLLQLNKESSDMHKILANLFEAFVPHFAIGGTDIDLSLSVGVVIAQDADQDINALLKQADVAMYDAKSAGKNCFRFYDQSMSEDSERRFLINNRFQHALANDEFLLHFQPIICMDSYRLVKLEALIRWQQPDGTMIRPDQFIPILEESSKINDLGVWVARKALHLLSQLQEFLPHPISMAINVSARQISDTRFIDELLKNCSEFQLSHSDIEVELTETSIIRDFKRANSWMTQVVESGFRLAIDDFGTGYSSLSYLTSLPFHTVKLDRSFINRIENNPSQGKVVKAVTDLVQNLGKTLVAEGIETLPQFRQLQTLGCDFGQGYFIAKPMPGEQLVDIISSYTTSQMWPMAAA